MKRVLLIDDHSIVLQGCRRLLQNLDIRDIIEATNLDSGYRLFRSDKPDVIVVDLALRDRKAAQSGLRGLLLIRSIRAEDSDVPILVFSMHDHPAIVRRAFDAGATGFLSKDAAPECFLEAFSAVCSGTPYLAHRLALQIAFLAPPDRIDPDTRLTRRELAIVCSPR